MKHTIDHIAAALKAGRRAKGFSQRDLAGKAGIPQSHISKIEAGAVDIRLSSLIDMARALDLEVMLLPRKYVPVVDTIVRGLDPRRPAYALDDQDNDEDG